MGNLSNLRAAIGLDADQPVSGEGPVAVASPPSTIGLGHTRWATHGRVTEENAHPHGDCTGHIHIVLNGIVENHTELRRALSEAGHAFSSETDAEIVAHMIEKHYEGDLTEAVRSGLRRASRPLRVRRHACRPPGRAGRRPPGVPADRRDRRRRDVRRLGHPRFLGGDPRGARPQERRDRDRHPRGGPDRRGRRDTGRARDRGGDLGRGGRREGRLLDLHAQGDPRAARRRGRDDHRPDPRRGPGGPLRARPLRRTS